MEYDPFDFYRRSFERSELGRTKKFLPLREIAKRLLEQQQAEEA